MLLLMQNELEARQRGRDTQEQLTEELRQERQVWVEARGEFKCEVTLTPPERSTCAPIRMWSQLGHRGQSRRPPGVTHTEVMYFRGGRGT